jgi:hypothetical protein
MATRDDLGSSPPGQVLVGSFGSSLSSPGCWIARKRVLPSGVKAGLRLHGTAGELEHVPPRDPAVDAGWRNERPVGLEGLVDAGVQLIGGHVGYDPEVVVSVEHEVVGAREAGLGAAGGEDLVGELLGLRVVVVLGEADDLAVEVAVVLVVKAGRDALLGAGVTPSRSGTASLDAGDRLAPGCETLYPG